MKLGKKEDLAIAAVCIGCMITLVHILAWVATTTEGMGAIAVLIEAAVFLLGSLAILMMDPIRSWYGSYKNNKQGE